MEDALFDNDFCPENCGGRLQEVEGEIEPARQVGGDIKDSVWGKWLECEKCGYQKDIE